MSSKLIPTTALKHITLKRKFLQIIKLALLILHITVRILVPAREKVHMNTKAIILLILLRIMENTRILRLILTLRNIIMKSIITLKCTTTITVKKLILKKETKRDTKWHTRWKKKILFMPNILLSGKRCPKSSKPLLSLSFLTNARRLQKLALLSKSLLKTTAVPSLAQPNA